MRFAFPIVVLLAIAGTSSAAEEPLGLTNLDFEDGTKNWAVYYSENPAAGPRFAWSIDTATFKTGKGALKVVADDLYGRAFVHQSTKQFAKGARFELSYWIKFSSPAMYHNCGVTVNLGKPMPGGKGRDLVQIDPVYKRGDNGWIHRKGFFTVDKDVEEFQIGLSVKNSLGTVWVDDIRLAVVPPGPPPVESLLDYAPGIVEHGPEMVKRYEMVRDKRPKMLELAKQYNELLVEIAILKDRLQSIERMAFYLESHGKAIDVKAARDAFAKLETDFDKLYQAYGLTFQAPPEMKHEEIVKALATFRKRASDTLLLLDENHRVLMAAAQARGFQWKPLRQPEDIAPRLAPDRKPNQLVFGAVSLQSHFELERPLGVNDLLASSIFEVKGDGAGKYDFSGIHNSWRFYQKLGVKQSSIGTAFAVHSNQMAPEWFLKKYENDPDIMMIGADGAKALRPTWSNGAPLNTWRPEVREMTADLIDEMGKAFKNQPQYQFYVVAPENGGPYFSSERDGKSIGYNKSALPDFHAWLKKRYGTIGALNKQWKTEHKSFEVIEPPADLLIVNEWPRPHPAGYEFQAWRNDHHHHWLKYIYDQFKKADPTKPVMADHSSLLAQIDGTRIFDTCDILSVHHHPQVTPTLATNYAYSLNRYAKKQMALYENGWGFAEPMPHHADEAEQRAALTKYLYRITAWGAHTQMWWYAYTSNDYMTRFNGNWFNPVYDLTTLRYSAAGLPIAKEKVKRLEEVFLNSTIRRSRVLVMQPTTSMLFQSYWKESYAEAERIHDILYDRNSHHEILPESFFTDGRAKLHDYDAIVLPYAPYLPDALANSLRDWVKKGGTLVALGPFGLYDPFGFDRGDFWKEVFGNKLPTRLTKAFRYYDQNRVWRWGWDEAADENPILDKPFGKGRVVAAMRSLGSAKMQGDPVTKIIDAIETKAPRAASSPSNELEFTIHEVTKGGKLYLCAINLNTARTITETVTLTGEFRSGMDQSVRGGFPVEFKRADGKTTFAVKIEPGGLALIELRN